MTDQVIKGDSIKRNFVFQFAYQLIILVLPLIISPYLTRTLGSESLGVYTFTYSIAYYFVICANLGISKYGQRIVAEKRSNVESLRRTVWSLIAFHIIVSVIVFGIYILYALFLCKENISVVIAQGIYVFSSIVDYTWVFQGLEKFKMVVIRNAIVKLLECIFIFSLVKSTNDLILYTMIMSISVCFGHMAVLPQIFKIIPPKSFTFNDLKEHVKPMIVLFVAAIAATLYTVFDKTLLGLLSNMMDVAIYEYSNKIVTIPRSFIVIISTVLFPKVCKMVSEGDMKGIEKSLDDSLMINYFIGFGSIFGLLGVGNLFAEIYYGLEFIECGNVMIAMSPLILIIGLGEVLRSQYIYPFKKDKIMVKILFMNAIINLVLSIIFIPKIGVYGAVIGTTIAEIFGLTFELMLCRKYLKISRFFMVGFPFLVIGFVMFFCIRMIASVVESNLCGLLIQIMIGTMIYVILAMIYCYHRNANLKNILDRMIRKFRK